jgi:hypothetical protein
LEVTLVRPSPAATTEVEAILVASTQPEGDASSAGTSEPREARAESWTSGSHLAWVGSWVSRGARWKSAKLVTKEPRRARRSDHLGWRSNDHPLFWGGLTTWARCLTASWGQRWKAQGNTRCRQWYGHGSDTGRAILQKNV